MTEAQTHHDDSDVVSDSLRVVVADSIATVTLHRPPVNAVNRNALRSIRDTFRSLSERRDVHVVVFTASGRRAFMGGADLNDDGGEVSTRLTDVTDIGRLAREAMWSVLDCAVPVVGAINGPAIGAGLAFAACCDMLVASEHAEFGALEINVGLLGASSQLSLMVGRQKAREMYFLGERVPAAEMYRLGAVRAVVSADELADTALNLANRLAKKSPIALRLAKESMNRVEEMPLKEAYRTEQDYTSRLSRFDDSREARMAYLEKREPQWKWS